MLFIGYTMNIEVPADSISDQQADEMLDSFEGSDFEPKLEEIATKMLKERIPFNVPGLKVSIFLD